MIVADVINAKVGDTIDDVPVIAGAFVDPAAADVPNADSSAAERAAAMSRPKQVEQSAPAEHRRRRSWKPWLIGAAVVIVLVAALGGTYAWTQTQYFVGRAGADVAIYRGVNTDLGPLKFYNVYKVTDLRLRDLNSSAQGQVHDGITASSEKDAENVVANLRNQQLPPCRPAVVVSPTPTSPTPTGAAPTSRTSSGTSVSRGATASSPGATTTLSGTAIPAPTTGGRTKQCSGTS